MPETAAPEASGIAERDLIWRGLRDLGRRQRAIVVLRFYEDVDHAAIASTLGIRVRRHRRTALAATALVAVAGGAWPRCPGPPPSRRRPKRPTPPGSGLARDVSTYPAAEFTSPDGNVYCRLDGDLAGCGLKGADPGVLPDPSTCATQGVVKGVAVNASGPASWACGSDPMAFPFLNGDGTRWWDASFGGTASWPNETRQLAGRRLPLHDDNGRSELYEHGNGPSLHGSTA